MAESIISTSESIGELAQALSKAQSKFPAIKTTQTATVPTKTGGSYSYAYADLATIFESIRAVLSEHGLSISQPMAARDGATFIVTRLLHSSGEWLESVIPYTTHERPQETGSAITYARRYSLSALLGLASEEDDDAAMAQKAKRKSGVAPRPPQAAPTSDAPNMGRLFALLTKLGIASDDARHQWAGVESFKDLTPAEVDKLIVRAVEELNRKLSAPGD